MVPLLGIVHPARPEVRFALVDSDDRFRGEIEEQAASRPHNVRCLGTFDSLLSTPVTLLKRLGIHVLLIDPDIPGFPLPSLLQCLRATNPACPIILLSHDASTEAILYALQCGADGYLLKSEGPDEILRRIADVSRGGIPLSNQASQVVWKHHRKTDQGHSTQRSMLTCCESRVMEQLATGARYKEAASHLGISQNTLRSHVRNAYRKLNANNLVEAVHKLQVHGHRI
jgi:DNA-binding NarL/FixJ family response regulator